MCLKCYKNFDQFNKNDRAVRSGQCARHLQSLYPEILWFEDFIIKVGDNDFNNTDNAELSKVYKDLSDHIP